MIANDDLDVRPLRSIYDGPSNTVRTPPVFTSQGQGTGRFRCARRRRIPQAAPASRHLGDLARYVAEAAQAARDHKPEEMRDPERAAKRARLFEMARAASARDHESALERKQVIERRKEEQERLMAEKKAAEDAEERRLEAERKKEEEARLEREVRAGVRELLPAPPSRRRRLHAVAAPLVLNVSIPHRPSAASARSSRRCAPSSRSRRPRSR